MTRQRKAAPETVADTLAELQAMAAGRHHAARETEAAAQLALARVEEARSARVEAHADGDATAIRRALASYEQAEQEAEAATLAAEGARLAAQRAQAEANEFRAANANRLIEERAADARELALKLTRAGHELVHLHRAYIAMRTDIDSLVGAIPNALPRSDGPPAAHPWERQLKDLERAVREVAEVEPPLPTLAGIEERQHQDRAARLLQLGRRKRLTDAEQHEMDRLSQVGSGQ